MRVHVKDGRLKMITAQPDNLATAEGVCLKGLSYIERVYSPDRLLFPLKRIAGTAKFERITWSEVLEILSGKLAFFREQWGAKSILYYTGSGSKGLLNSVGLNFWRLFGGCTTTYGDLCWPAGLEATRLTLGENKHNVPWDIARAALIILWGKNPAETNIHQMYYIEKARKNGARVVVIDPRRTQSCEQADYLLQPRPGTDGALALVLARILIEQKKTDPDFIKKYVRGYPQFRESALAMEVEQAVRITDIPAAHIEQLAALLGSTKPVTINAGFGMQRYSNSGQTMRAIIALLALTGNIGKEGAGWIYANLQSSIFDTLKDPLAFYPPEKPEDKIRVSISTARLGEQMLAATDPPLKMIWVERGNPLTQNPDTNTLLKAFKSLEFRVVIDQFMTDTARAADLILPAKTMFEQSDIIGAYWHPYIQLKQKIIDPPGEVKPETEIYYLLAGKLGLDNMNGMLPQPSDEAIDAFLSKKLAPFPGLSIERLKNGPILAPASQEIAFSDMLFPTPSGKIELYSPEAEKRWNVSAVADYKEPLESTSAAGKRDIPFPLYFMTPNTKNRIHSQFNNLDSIRQFSEKPCLQMHPLDARSRGIKNGDRVKIYNRRGTLFSTALLDFSIKRGCVAMTNGWWISEGGTVNFLSLGRETDMGYGAAFHENLVEVIQEG
jgi:anaerobic selenocysteine-containing dehydrogenase